MLTQRYLASTKNVPALMAKIVDGVAPAKFTLDHLKSIGFGSSNDRAIIPLLKDLGFLSPDGAPLPRYNSYRDRSNSKAIMAQALRDAYEEVFHIREVPTPADRQAVEGLFRSKLNSSERVAQLQAMTFFAFLPLADLGASPVGPGLPAHLQREDQELPAPGSDPLAEVGKVTAQLHYTIQIHLPATGDIAVFNAIFRSLRENLLR
ncbi:MAG: DUF5343 domain-containing protein [Candidatus Dormibacteria bacterium]